MDGFVRIAVPNKGRLQEPALKLLEASGIEPAYGDTATRTLVVPTNRDNVILVFARARDVPNIVASGAAELGITGYDFIVEAGASVVEELDLGFGRASLVLAVPVEMGIERPDELPRGARVATKYTNIAKRYFEGIGVDVEIMRISGAAEVMPRLGAADAIIDVMSTGTTLMLHGLKPIAVVLESSARLIRSSKIDPAKKDIVEEIIENVKGVVQARKVKLLLMNVPDDSLRRITEILSATNGSLIARIEGPEPLWEIITAVPEDRLSSVIMDAKRRGARDIVVLNIERVIP